MNRRPRPLVWFWILAPLAAGVLLWSSFQALLKERATNAGRAFWLERNEVSNLLGELDHAVQTLLAEESAKAPELYQSFHEAKDSVPAAVYFGEGKSAESERAAWIPSPFIKETRSEEPTAYAKLHFQLFSEEAQESLSIAAAPNGAERQLSLSHDLTTQASLARAETLGTELKERIGLATIAHLAREAALSPQAPLAASANFAAFFFDATRADGKRAAELIALRLVELPSGDRALQGIWYDWPRLRAALETLAMAKLSAGEVSLTPATELLKKGAAPPPRRPVITRDGGRLANLALDVAVGGRPAPQLPIWTGTAQSLAAAWLVVLAALFAIHHSLVRAAALSERRARFASAVTHELRTPLTTLCMYAEMLSAGLVQDEKLKEYYATLKREADRLAALVDNVLDHAGLESGRVAELQTLDLGAWLRELGPRFEQSGATLEVDLVGACEVKADPGGLERILTNLIDNAKKYGAAPITLHLAKAGRRCELRVTDAGAGIAPGVNVFGAFTRGDHSPGAHDSGSSTRGLGLGLALSLELARAMGGDLILEHRGPATVTKGKGAARDAAPTTFLLSLPLIKSPSQAE